MEKVMIRHQSPRRHTHQELSLEEQRLAEACVHQDRCGRGQREVRHRMLAGWRPGDHWPARPQRLPRQPALPLLLAPRTTLLCQYCTVVVPLCQCCTVVVPLCQYCTVVLPPAYLQSACSLFLSSFNLFIFCFFLFVIFLVFPFFSPLFLCLFCFSSFLHVQAGGCK